MRATPPGSSFRSFPIHRPRRDSLAPAARRQDPNLTFLSDAVRGIPAYEDLLQRVRKGGSRSVVSGGVGALPGLLLARLARDIGRRLAVLVADEKESERIATDLRAGGMSGVFRAPAPNLTPTSASLRR
jgi:hypothetical protein